MAGAQRAEAATDWIELVTPGNGKYYVNKETGQSLWTIPEDLKSASDWQEHEPLNSRYYYNKVTKQASWEKPVELMSPTKRLPFLIRQSADASTVWKEYTTFGGRTYYVNKETKESVGTIPEELKLARKKAEMEAAQGSHLELSMLSNASTSAILVSAEQTLTCVPSVSSATNSGVHASPVSVTPVSNDNPSVTVSGSSATPTPHAACGGGGALAHPNMTPLNGIVNTTSNVVSSSQHISSRDNEEAKNSMALAGKVNLTSPEEKPVEDEPLVNGSKQIKKEREKEEKEKKKDKEKREKDKEKEREKEREKGKDRPRKDEADDESLEITDSYGHKEDKKKDKERKHRKRHSSANDDVSSDKEEKEDGKRSRRHGSDRKKSRKHDNSPESDGESRHKKHKRDRESSRRNGHEEQELEDGELGEDGEIN